MKYQNILVENEAGIGQITLNRPEVYNALDPQTWSEIRDAIRDISFDKTIRVVIIAGAGVKAFASGADIKTIQKRKPIDILQNEAPDILNEIENLNQPVIAAISGFALGGGCELAMACDIRIATRHSKFGLPEVGLGVIPGAGGTQRLQKLVGLGKAKELTLTGDIINADEAKEIGLVNTVIDEPEDLLPTAKKVAQKIIAKGPMAIALAKKAINLGTNTDIHSGLLFEKLAQTILFSTKDRIEGIAAFLEKRKPKFKGE